MRYSRLTVEGRRLSSAVGRLGPWLLGMLLFGMIALRSDLGATAGLFQSGVPTAGLFQSGVATPSETIAPTPSPTAELTATALAVPSPSATAPLTPTVTPTSPPAAPSLTATATTTPTSTPPLAATATAIATRVPSPTAAGRYPADEADLKFDLRMLFDAVALGLSYLWLACGILLLLGAIPLFVVLWMISRRQSRGE